MSRRPPPKPLALSALYLFGWGCAALHPPPPLEASLRDQAPIVADEVATGAWPGGSWWKSYGDPQLDQLVELAIGQGPGIAVADARIREAQEQVRVAGAALGLRLDASGKYQAQRLSDNGLIPPDLLGFHWYDQADLGVTARYQFDWWGRERATMEAALDRSRASAAERQAAALALAGAVSEAYFGWQADSARLVLHQQVVALQEQSLQLAQRRVGAELESADTLPSARQRLAAQREMLEGVRGSLQLRIVALAGLLGVTADALPPLVPRPLPAVSAALPGDAGINLVARRPDVQASRWRVEAALRDTDVQRAAFYPDISLQVLAGLSSIDLGRLFRADSAAPSAGIAVDLPLFDAGLRRARHQASAAALAAAIAAYDEAVVNAAREAGRAVASLQQVARQRTERDLQLAAARELSRSAEARVAGGISHQGPLLSARIAQIAQQDQLLQIDLAAVLADIQLKEALAGEPAPGNTP